MEKSEVELAIGIGKQVGIGVFREALPDEIVEMIEETKNDGNILENLYRIFGIS